MESKPRLLLMGLRRSGKSSIQNVVFHKMQPNDTLFLDSTSKVSRNDVLSFIDFDLWDFPGNIDTADLDLSVFQRCGALVFVIDAQDDFMEALQRLYSTVITANHINKNMSFEVFIHKVDGLSDDHKIGYYPEYLTHIGI
ncbi:hypothetical protein HDV02_003856 [Globomyces sp. JEL0801]|nr:hypothetical protein HDV02_003856 [Globomyces sp. JEL0801]